MEIISAFFVQKERKMKCISNAERCRRSMNENKEASHMEIWVGTDAFESGMYGMVL